MLKMNKYLLSVSLALISLHTLAEGYMNENMVIFSSSSDGSNNPWQANPKCTPVIQKTSTTQTWSVQYNYPDGSPLTSRFLTTAKPSMKAAECEHLVHFPDNIQSSGTFESFYPNGKLRSRIPYTDGIYNGKLTFWFASGLKEQKSTLRNGVSDGEYRIWHPNGQLALSMGYKDDAQHGMKQRWYEDSQPWTYVRFENGQMQGELKQWFRNGQMERQGEYRKGQRHGTYKAWYDDGTPQAVLNYQTGKIISAQCWNEMNKPVSTKQCMDWFKDEE
jgi:antitoxin component YwqK of YwqJK toxin-antitoxin module